MFVNLGIWAFFVLPVDSHAAPEGVVVNVVNFKAESSFPDRFTTASGHRLELVNGDLFTIDQKLAEETSSLIGDELLKLEKIGREKP